MIKTDKCLSKLIKKKKWKKTKIKSIKHERTIHV